MKQSPRQYISSVVASFVILLATFFLSFPAQSGAAFGMPVLEVGGSAITVDANASAGNPLNFSAYSAACFRHSALTPLMASAARPAASPTQPRRQPTSVPAAQFQRSRPGLVRGRGRAMAATAGPAARYVRQV